MGSAIRQNSYWYADGEDDEAKMTALCVMCAKKQDKGWFWEGKVLGYGDYDLFCSSCGNAIHIRGNIETQADNETERQQEPSGAVDTGQVS